MAAASAVGALTAANGGSGKGNNGHHAAGPSSDDGDFVVVYAPSEDGSNKLLEHHQHQHQHQPSLFRDPNVPPLARWGVPLLLLANDALLLYSNLGDGATVTVKIFDGDTPDGNGRSIESAPLYTITLGRSIQDMWSAKAYFTSVLIAVFAGAWPHIKSLTSFLCWVLDGRRLGRDARRALLTLAYVLQKLSHVETFVLVILMTGGSLKAHLPEHDDWGVRSVIKPQTGFYCFLTGLCCSMFLSRVALHYDYIATAAWEEAAEARGGQEQRPYAAAAADPLGGSSDERLTDEKEEDAEWASSLAAEPAVKDPHHQPRPRCCSSCCAALARVAETVGIPSGSYWQDIGVPYLLVGMLAFFCVGLATPCFRFNYEGLAGWVMTHVTENWPDVSPAVKTSTVVSLGLGVPDATDAPDIFGTRYLQAAFLFFVVVAPLGCLAFLLAFALLPVRMAGKLLTAAEVLYAWSAPDVLFVSMVTCTLEIRNFVHFVLGDRCDGLNAVLRAVFDKELHGDDVCFDMVASLETGIWIYGAASLVFFAVGALILRNLQREYAPFLADEQREHRRLRQARQQREQQQRRRGRGCGRGRLRGLFSSLFGWTSWKRHHEQQSSSSRAATMPLLVEEGREEGKLDGLPPKVTITTSRP